MPTERADQLLDAAMTCFARRGLHATTVTDISSEAGCSQGLLYRYFAGKDALIGALMAREAAEAVQRLDTVAAADDPIAALMDIADRFLHDHQQGSALQLEAVAEAARDTRIAEVVRRTLDDVLDALVSTLESGQASGAFDRQLDATATARTLLALVDGLCYQRAVDPDLASERQLHALGHLLRKLLTPAEHATPPQHPAPTATMPAGAQP